MLKCQLIFWSLAEPDFSVEDLRDISAAASRNNERARIRSLLIFGPPFLLEIAEGGRGALSSMFARIEIDNRHTSPELVQFVEIESNELLLSPMRMEYISTEEGGNGADTAMKSRKAFTPNKWSARECRDFVQSLLECDSASA